VIQSALSSGGALWNGQWLNFQVQVPSNYSLPAWCTTAPTNACYWDLYYSVASGATAGDTFAVTAGFTGSPEPAPSLVEGAARRYSRERMYG